MRYPEKLILATTIKAQRTDIEKLRQKGVDVILTKSKKGMVDLEDLMKYLGKRELMSIMIEGGSELNSSAIKAGIVDKILMFAAPKLIGNGLGAIGNLGIDKINKAINLRNQVVKKIGKDVFVEAYI